MIIETKNKHKAAKMENKKTKFEEFLLLRSKLGGMIFSLQNLGIYMVTDNSIVNYKLNFQEIPDIVKELDELDFFDELSQTQELALALAVTQESQNSFIEQFDINTVNNFFGTKITFELVQEMNMKYV